MHGEMLCQRTGLWHREGTFTTQQSCHGGTIHPDLTRYFGGGT